MTYRWRQLGRFLGTHPSQRPWLNWLVWCSLVVLAAGAVGSAVDSPKTRPAAATTTRNRAATAGRTTAPPVGTTAAPAASSTAAPSNQHRSSSPAAPTPAPAAGGDDVTPAGVVLPNARRTPGAVNPAVTQANIDSTICVSGWTATIRPPSSYTTRLKEDQLATGYAYHGDLSTADYEEDHLVSLELGGSPTSELNLWPEPYAASDGARVKDRIENELHALVCDGRLSLATAQRAIASNWYVAYETYLGTPGAPAVTTTAPAPAPRSTSAPPAATALTCGASMSNAQPAQYSTTDVLVRTSAGASVTATAHYKSKDTTHSASADGSGRADLPFDISRATVGYPVVVDVTVSAHGTTAACQTSFTPVGG